MANQEMVPPSRLKAVAEAAVKSIGLGFDMAMECRLENCKNPDGLRLIDIDDDHVRDLTVPGVISVPSVPECIKCGKGERMRFRSDVLSFEQLDRIGHGLTFMDSSTLSIYSHKEEITFFWRRRGGSNCKNMSHEKWCLSVKLEPEVISMTFVPIVSLLSGVHGSGFLSHAINLYLRYKPPVEALNQFLEFQIARKWAPEYGQLNLVPGRKQQSDPCLQFSFLGPKLYVNTDLVDVDRRPVTGARLYLEGRRSNCLAIHLQHLSSCPQHLQLLNESSNKSQTSFDQLYHEKVRWKMFSHVCTAPVESDDELSIVTGAHFQVKKFGFKDVLFLQLQFSKVSGDAIVLRKQVWDDFSDSSESSGGLLASFFSSSIHQKKLPKPSVNLNSALYPDGPPIPVGMPELLRFVDTKEMTRGPQDLPGFWVVSGSRLVIHKGKISLSIKYSLFSMDLPS